MEEAAQYLKPGICFEQLDRLAQAESDTRCAERMHRAKSLLLRRVKLESPFPPRFE